MTVELYQQDRLGPALDLDRIMGFPIVRPKFQIPAKQACEVSNADGHVVACHGDTLVTMKATRLDECS